MYALTGAMSSLLQTPTLSLKYFADKAHLVSSCTRSWYPSLKAIKPTAQIIFPRLAGQESHSSSQTRSGIFNWRPSVMGYWKPEIDQLTASGKVIAGVVFSLYSIASCLHH